MVRISKSPIREIPTKRRMSTIPIQPPIIWTYLPGRIPYAQAAELQKGMVASRLQAKKRLATTTNLSAEERRNLSLLAQTDMLLLLEHAPVFTLGRRQGSPAEEHALNKMLVNSGADIVQSTRGGQTTYHGPGQLVGYPIMDLSNMKMSVRDYVCNLERFLRRLAEYYQVPTISPSPHTGAFVDANTKIGSIGVHVQQRLTSHGFALNVDNQSLPWFHKIVACGLDDVRMTSIQDRHRYLGLREGELPLKIEQVVPRAAEIFGQVFQRPMYGEITEEVPEEEPLGSGF